MNTPTKLSISDAALLYKKSRATIYKDIKNGNLSRDTSGEIDFSELIRVYGEPKKPKTRKRIEDNTIQNTKTSEYNENTIQELKNQIHFLKQQLEKAEEREEKANTRIDTLLTLIEMKKPNEKEEPIEVNHTDKKEEPKQEPVQEEKQKKGILKRFFW